MNLVEALATILAVSAPSLKTPREEQAWTMLKTFLEHKIREGKKHGLESSTGMQRQGH